MVLGIQVAWEAFVASIGNLVYSVVADRADIYSNAGVETTMSDPMLILPQPGGPSTEVMTPAAPSVRYAYS